MALGLPVISTDCPCGGPRTLINNNQNGILVKVNDKEELANNIIKLIEDSNFRKKIGDKASQIVELVNPDKINKKWEEFIKTVIE